MDDRKIVIYQPNVRPYRVALFEGVAKRYPGGVKVCAAPFFDGNIPSCHLNGVEMDYGHPYRRLFGFEWQVGFSLDGLRPHRDVVVICGEPRNLSMMWIALKARLMRLGVVWWSLHMMPNQDLHRLAIRKCLMLKLASTILFYNKTGIAWLRSEGRDVTHVFATGNTIDQNPIKEAIQYWAGERLQEFKRREGLLGKKIILTCSRIIEKQRLHEAIEALARMPLANPNILLVVIGDGPLKKNCEELAVRLGVAERVRWLGAVYDEKQMAPWFMSAKAFTYPGPVGLAILKALSYGLPAVINDTHNSTEAEIMENGKTGLLFREHDIEDLAHVLDGLMSDEERWRRMSEYSQKVAYENYSMGSMVGNFCAAVDDAAQQMART